MIDRVAEAFGMPKTQLALKRSLALPEHVKPDRLQLVGLQFTSHRGTKCPLQSELNVSVGGAAKALGSACPNAPAVPDGHAATRRSFIVGDHLRLESSVNPTDGWITSAATPYSPANPLRWRC